MSRPQPAPRPRRRPRARALLACTLLSAGLAAAAPGPASIAAPGTPPALLATLGGPGHAAMYPSGLEYSSFDDTLVVADTGNHRLSKFDPVTGALLWSVGGYGTAGGYLNDPRDVGVDSLGNIYVADTGNVRIAKFDASGAFLTSWRGPAGDLAGSPIGVTVSTVSGTDRVYVADAQDLLVRVWNTALDTQLVAFGSDGACVFSNVRDVAASADGTVFIANFLKNDILRMSASGTCLGSWGTSGTDAGEFRNPYGVQVTTDPVSGDELVYVADSNNDRVQVFGTDGSFVAQWGAFGDYDVPGTFSAIRRVAVDGEGGLWGADLWGWSVEHAARGPGPVPVYASDRSIPAVPAAPPFTNSSVFNEARQVAFDGGDVVVMDTVNQRVVRMDATTGAIDGPACGRRGWENGAFNWPRGVAVDPVTHDLWIADTKQSQIQIIKPNCTFVAKLPATTSVPPDQRFNYPTSIAIRDSDGTAWVTDSKNHRIKVYDVATRALLAVYGTNGDGAGEFVQPQGIAIGPDGDVYVADTNNERIVELAATPDAADITWVRTVTAGLSRPEGIAIDDSGRMYIADTLHDRLVILNAGGSVAAIVSGGLQGPESVSVDPTGRIFLSDTYHDRVLVFEALPDGPPGPTLHYVDDLVGPGLADLYPVDIAADANDYYVMDPGRYRVVRIDRATGTVIDSVGGHQGRQPGQFGAARAIALDASGRVYVADTPNNRVQRFSPDLTFQTSWGSTGTGPGQFTQVYGIAVGPGTLPGGGTGQVVYTTDGDRVQRFTTDGAFISQFGRKALNQPRQLDVNPTTHDIYVASARDRRVVVFGPNGRQLFRFGGEGTANGKFMGDIRGVEVSDSGRVFISDDGNRRVQVFTSKGAYLYQFGNTGTGAKRLVDARGLATTPDNKVVVADEWAFALKEWSYTKRRATFQRKLFGGGPPAPGMNAPRGMAVDPGSGALYAVDWWNQRIERFGANGAYQLQWGHRGTRQEPGSINFAWDAAVDPASGNVYVANRESHEIEVFAPNGDYVTRWGTRGSTDGKLTFPQGVAFDPTDGSLLVADAGNDRIQRFDILPSGEGEWVATYGGPSPGTAPGEFDVPTGIAVEADGTIWVADTANSRIQRRNPGGGWTAFTQAAGDTTTFKSPWGVSVGPDGNIWVADTGRSRVVKMSPAGDLSYTADGPSLGLGPIDGPFDVAFGPAGQIYVSLVWDNRILHLEE